jgi:uncharacterized damage-inducible protein DinB
MIEHNKTQLTGLICVINQIPNSIYLSELSEYNISAVGHHIRHIIEIYQQLITGAAEQTICYDSRRREVLIATDRRHAIIILRQLLVQIDELDENRQITILASYSTDITNDNEYFESTLKRELAYAFDHTTHHLALIKLVLKILGINLPKNLGVAPATIRHATAQ